MIDTSHDNHISNAHSTFKYFPNIFSQMYVDDMKIYEDQIKLSNIVPICLWRNWDKIELKSSKLH